MYFCSGPPRAYAAPPASQQRERFEDVGVAMHPHLRVFARVTSSHIALWSASLALQHPQYRKRHLVSVPREQGGEAAAAHTSSSDAEPLFQDGNLQRVFAVWVAENRLAVVEKGAQTVEFYAFEGLEELELAARDGALDHAEPHASGSRDALASPSASLGAALKGQFVEAYPLNQGESQRDVEDTAASMSGIAGGKYLFVGMASGLICVVEVAMTNDAASWFGNAERTKIWKIDVLPHLQAAGADAAVATDGDASTPACYALACASSDAPSRIASLLLVACFEGGKCFIMQISPGVKCIDQLLSLVNTERDASPSCFGRCTAVALDPNGARLALGWSDGGVSLFRLAVRVLAAADTSAPAKAALPTLTLEPIRELNLAAWGYTTEDVGAVTAIAWSLDARTVAVGYELRGFSLFSLDGCRLMSSLPQHNQQRPEPSDEHALKEACASGVLRLLWTRESMTLIIVPRGEQCQRVEIVAKPAEDNQDEDADDEEAIILADLYEDVVVELFKEANGLCLSLSGAPGRCGAWVRSDNSFTRRARDGGVGPAEASGRICGGDLLVGINGDSEVVNVPFEQVVRTIKELENNASVTLSFLRLRWDSVFPLAVRALTSEDFLNAFNIPLLRDEDMCVREYALRMQVLHGDCDLEARPPLLEFEKRAKFDGWAALQGVSTSFAQHRYMKLLFALFPVWNPRHVLQVVMDYGNAILAHELQQEKEQKRSQQQRQQNKQQLVAARKPSRLGFVEFDFAKSVPLSGGKTSHLVLLEAARLRLVASPSLDDPCALTSCVSWSVPADFEAKCAPLRLVAVSASGNHIAVAGQKGFCLLNLVTGKWRMFGNVNDEQDMFVHSLLWVQEDAIVVNFTRFSEAHKTMHLQAYPRNHLDDASILAKLAYSSVLSAEPTDNTVLARAAAAAPSGGGANDAAAAMFEGDLYKGDCFRTMESGEDETTLYCVSRKELWSFSAEVSGSVKTNDLALALQLRRKVKLPPRIADAAYSRNSAHTVLDFTVIPRFAHVQDETLREAQQKQLQAEREFEQQETKSGWLSSLVSLLAGGEVPDQYKPEEVLPRFAFVDAAGDVIVWDPESRSQRVLCSNVSTMARLFVTATAAPAWPAHCRLMYGLYGPDGMRVWLPLLDGVYMAHTKAFEADEDRLETFLACHDPLRAKTYEIEFGTAPATAELYEQVVAEYGIALERFHAVVSSSNGGTRRVQLEDGVRDLRGCIASVDDPSAKDRMLRFDSDVKVLGVQQAFGLLVGVSQDVYVPSGVFHPCYDIFSRVQPFFHTLLCFLVQNRQLSWAREIVRAVRSHFALSTPTQELFLHAMLEARFSGQCSEQAFHDAIQLLQPSAFCGARAPVGDEDEAQAASGDQSRAAAGGIDEYCEIVAHVARKSEPSRLKWLFPAAGDPLELLAICKQRSELRTAANFLLVLEESSPSAPPSFRKACAAELVALCIEHEEWNLAQHVVRVARDWEHPDDDGNDKGDVRSIDEQLAQFVWNDFVHGEYERVVWSVEGLQAKLPPARAQDIEIQNEQEEAIVMERLREVFVEGNKLRQLRTLLQAVTEARYTTWTKLIKQVMA